MVATKTDLDLEGCLHSNGATHVYADTGVKDQAATVGHAIRNANPVDTVPPSELLVTGAFGQ
jgi:hypothetical protein